MRDETVAACNKHTRAIVASKVGMASLVRLCVVVVAGLGHGG